jgi:RimJ/RimL family protein N-acetyltransferase
MRTVVAQRGALRARVVDYDDVDMLVLWHAAARIHERDADEPYGTDVIARWVELDLDEPERMVIIEESGAPVATFHWHLLRDRPRTGNLFGFVAPHATGRGIGRQAVGLMADYLVTSQRCLRVMAHPNNDPAESRALLNAGFGIYCYLANRTTCRYPTAYYPAARAYPPLLDAPGPARTLMDWRSRLAPNRVPNQLRHLIPLARRWGILDNTELWNLIFRAPLSDLEELVTHVDAASPELQEWLEDIETHTDAPPDEYIALAAMIEATRRARGQITVRHARD